ncbi:ATP-dependent sacrificial sulfur transferase LarE [Clostridium sp. PL3]|uniref:ATP-dependent sacrificial sulfur transferase LarE n=1 Tax=Clostridium thailandense TaxID=2794346 RepID=A0A949TM42_9CLOT|nr:ATP-dependent sacrificial sulfur transferase LarE [Clostridium thailandense]MBV7272972.1 ATP-dependent sacrificial sulfur transferase LarE [Clostridium thailandense]
MISDRKYEDLIDYLKKLDSIVIAFSGGVDSTFLMKAAKEALGDRMMAVTIVSPYIPKWELEEAKEIAKDLNIKHQLIEFHSILGEIKFNPKDRCYLCKKFVFSKIIEFQKEKEFKYVIDGTNLDDTKDYRPGMKALKELSVVSPLLENNITKEDIRRFSKDLGLSTWDKPAYACLLSRIPYNQEIKFEDLRKIENAELYLMELGFKGIRVRSHEDLARIEVQRQDRKKICDEELMDKICEKFKELGFKHITLDLQGYIMGSFNN